MPLDTIVLLGWLERDDAIAILRNECEFPKPLTEEGAVEIWETYRQRVLTLPDRVVGLPKKRQMTGEEKNWERQFLQFYRDRGAKIKSLVKVNLMELVIHQLTVVANRASDYGNQLSDSKGIWNEKCLPIREDQVQITAEMRNFGPRFEVDINLPHAEWFFEPAKIPPNNALCFRPAPALRYVTVTVPEADRMVLWAGYHRSYGWAANNRGEGMDCPALVALAENLVEPPTAGNLSKFDRLVRGPRPPLFRDFFDDFLFMRIPVKRKRYQMQIRSQIVAIDDP